MGIADRTSDMRREGNSRTIQFLRSGPLYAIVAVIQGKILRDLLIKRERF